MTKALVLAISMTFLPVWGKAQAACPDFHFASSGFSSVERDYQPALLYLWTGNDSNNHGVAFLIDASKWYYLTARHVVELSISDPARPIRGVDSRGHEMELTLVDEDKTLDVALLERIVKGDGSDHLNLVQPYEIFLSNIGPEEVTHSGCAYAEREHFKCNAPKEARFEYDDEAVLMQLKVATDEGDSGSPVYTKEGLVIGIVIKKQRLSQATAVAMKNLTDFVTRHATGIIPGVRQLHDVLLNTSDRGTLVDKLMPRHAPGAVSNLQLLGAIGILVTNRELGRMKHELVTCPIIQAAGDRGLTAAASKLEVLEANLEVAEKYTSAPPLNAENENAHDIQLGTSLPFGGIQLTPLSDKLVQIQPKWRGFLSFNYKHQVFIVNPHTMVVVAIIPESELRAEAVGDVLLARAAEWEKKGNASLFRSLSREAQSSYRDAIAAHLQKDNRPLFVFAQAEKEDKDPANRVSVVKSGEILARLGIDSEVVLGRDLKATPVNDPEGDDRFAALLNKYYEASLGATGGWHVLGPWTDLTTAAFSDDPKASAARNTAAAWATLTATSQTQKVKSWSSLGDALLKAGQPDDAARSLASAYRMQREHKIIQSYVDAKKQYTGKPYVTVEDKGVVQMAISHERPLSREDILQFGYGQL